MAKAFFTLEPQALPSNTLNVSSAHYSQTQCTYTRIAFSSFQIFLSEEERVVLLAVLKMLHSFLLYNKAWPRTEDQADAIFLSLFLKSLTRKLAMLF